ncbi:ZIP family metal transporter [Methanobacterium formicicum]|uniref:Peptidoglycan-binding LysM n=1 Tax=Methanobacterium formicicum (strain DSM 3637 / PP1) TaxID=1204725 RepID=K2QC57_METFP|nr:ZIP family metal transporter [Methanobacterium formicicum]EKF85576.1 peptidoglycan-binding LysM [Methanobacterium formicicum DSM 3637]
MNELLVIFLYSLLPVLGTFAGGLTAEFFQISKKNLSLALHAATGIILAVISVELIPRSLNATTPWIVILAFVAGGVFFVILDQLINYMQVKSGDLSQSTAAWAIFVGTTIDSFTDGLMIGTGALVSINLGLLLAVGVVSADLPEGFATVAALKDKEIERKTRILLLISASVPVLIGAAAGYLLVKGQSPIVEYSILAFTAGILLTVTVEEIIPESHKHGEARLAALVLISAFALFTLISNYLPT